MSELFKGAVLYKPSLSEVLNLRATLDFINDNPININEVFDRHTTPHWWEAKIGWVALSAELDSILGGDGHLMVNVVNIDTQKKDGG